MGLFLYLMRFDLLLLFFLKNLYYHLKYPDMPSRSVNGSIYDLFKSSSLLLLTFNKKLKKLLINDTYKKLSYRYVLIGFRKFFLKSLS